MTDLLINWFQNHASGLAPIPIVWAIYFLLSRGLKRMTSVGWLTTNMEKRVRILVRSISLGAAILLTLQAFGMINHAWTIITAVITAVAIGFVAHWSILSNWASALFILVYKRFNIGDCVELLEAFDKPDGLKGRVIDINLLYTELQELESKNILQIPNNLFFQKTTRVLIKDESSY